jgi:adenine-specific DNA-methyltransferase
MPVEKIEPGAPESQSADLLADNLARLKALFPELVTERQVDGRTVPAVNVDVLKSLVGDATVTDADEKFGLNWHGKRAARQLALTPSTGTLRPCRDESVDWDTTQNLMIEGDNLEVLKLLQKSYAGKVKLIYIDPPYNTGKDFVYPDNFQDSIKNYLELTGQVEGGRKIASNTESSGRFHTDWLNMIYPRLAIARNLLRPDGCVFISIDDVEVARLRQVCDEVLGAENFVAEVIWEGANKNDARQIGTVHEYVLVYARSREMLPREWGIRKEGVEPVLAEVARLMTLHGGDHEKASVELAGWFRAMKATPSFLLRRFRYIDSKGAYKEDDPTAPGGRKFDLIDPRSGHVIPLRRNRGWGFDQKEFDRLVSEGRISFISDTSIMVRRYLHETDKLTPPSIYYQPARSASERLATLMGEEVFDFPKDETILAKFVEMATDPSDSECIVMDFFAGSGTTAHAVVDQNIADGGRRRYVLVQLPEPLDDDSSEQRAAAAYCARNGIAKCISSLTRQRLRRVREKVLGEYPEQHPDLGFRAFSLDSSNIASWSPQRDDLAKSLFEHLDHVDSKRSDEDVLYELLLKLGLDLCVPIAAETIAGKTVQAIGGGVLMCCLDKTITAAEAEPLALGIAAWRKALDPAGDVTCVFRDSAFENDVAKTNLAAILEQHGIAKVRSL